MRHVSTISQPPLLGAEDVIALGTRLRRLCASQPVLLLYLCGAHARGRQTVLSDVDVAVLFAETDSASRERVLAAFVRLVEEAVGREDIDLLVLNDAGPIIKGRVVHTGKLIFARREAERIRFESAAIKQAIDFDYFARSYNRTFFRHLKKGASVG